MDPIKDERRDERQLEGGSEEESKENFSHPVEDG